MKIQDGLWVTLNRTKRFVYQVYPKGVSLAISEKLTKMMANFWWICTNVIEKMKIKNAANPHKQMLFRKISLFLKKRTGRFRPRPLWSFLVLTVITS